MIKGILNDFSDWNAEIYHENKSNYLVIDFKFTISASIIDWFLQKSRLWKFHSLNLMGPFITGTIAV